MTNIKEILLGTFIVLPMIFYGDIPAPCQKGVDSLVLGCTIYSENKIYIRNDLTEWGKNFVLLHELCHFVGERSDKKCNEVASLIQMSKIVVSK